MICMKQQRKMENNEMGTYLLDLEDLLPKIKNHTNDEIKFVNLIYDQILIDPEENQEIFLTTTSEGMGEFITHIIREYNLFRIRPVDDEDE